MEQFIKIVKSLDKSRHSVLFFQLKVRETLTVLEHKRVHTMSKPLQYAIELLYNVFHDSRDSIKIQSY